MAVETVQRTLFPINGRSEVSCRKQYWLTPPDLYAKLDAEFHFDFDPCPYPLPEGFNGLECEWGESNYVNPPFRKNDALDGRGPTAFAAKAIQQQGLGKTCVVVLPIYYSSHILLNAGAEFRVLGRIPWIEVETGEPSPRPGPVALFILHGNDHAA